MADSYGKRQDGNGLWEIYVLDSEEVVTVDGLPLTALDEAEADEALPRLNSGRISPDTSPATP